MKLSTASFRSTLIGMVSYVLQCNVQRDSRADFTRESLDAAPLSRIALLQQKNHTIFAGRNNRTFRPNNHYSHFPNRFYRD